MFDVDKGLRGSVIHHKPLTVLQLKRLLLLFDELHFTPPNGEKVFLEEGAICYRYGVTNDNKVLYSLDGFDLIKKHTHVKAPTVPENSLALAKLLHYGQDYPAVIPNDILPYYKNNEFEKIELNLLNRFEKAIDRGYIKFMDYKKSSFYRENSILLKIAFDFDSNDSKSVDYLKKLLIEEKNENQEHSRIIATSPLMELKGFEWFPKVKYQSHFDSTVSHYDFETQFFSIVAKVNKTLALTQHFDLIPVFIDKNIFNFYQYKIQKAKFTKDENFRQEWNISHNYELMNLGNLLLTSSSIFIEDQFLNKITIPQILSYKERCIDDLYKLRKGLFQEIGDLVKIESSEIDFSEMKKFVEKKLLPDLRKYQDAQNDVLTGVLRNTVRYTVAFSSAYIGFAQGLSPLLISLLSGVSPVLADDAFQLAQKLKDKRKKKYENTFSYFLNLNSK